MKRADLKEGTVFRRKDSVVRDLYKIRGARPNLQVWSYTTPDCTGTADFEGYLLETDSHKGFTIANYIINKEVAAFFPFKDFELVNPSNQS